MEAPLNAGNQDSERLIKIRGLDLQIDKSVQEICQVSNATSSHTHTICRIPSIDLVVNGDLLSQEEKSLQLVRGF
jgi:hypothetical protein